MGIYTVEIELTEFQELVIQEKFGKNVKVEEVLVGGLLKTMAVWEDSILANTEQITKEDKIKIFMEKKGKDTTVEDEVGEKVK